MALVWHEQSRVTQAQVLQYSLDPDIPTVFFLHTVKYLQNVIWSPVREKAEDDTAGSAGRCMSSSAALRVTAVVQTSYRSERMQ